MAYIGKTNHLPAESLTGTLSGTLIKSDTVTTAQLAKYFGDRGLYAGGNMAGTPHSNTIDYYTIPIPAAATDFGDLTNSPENIRGGCSNGSRGVFAGGYQSNGLDVIQYVTISVPGNATDFGNLTGSTWNMTGCSNGCLLYTSPSPRD